MSKKSKFSTIFIVFLLFSSTSVYAISQADLSGKFNEIIDDYLAKIVEEKMTETVADSDDVKDQLAEELQGDLDTAKVEAGQELEAYIEAQSEQHLINLELMEDGLKVELLDQAEISLEKQKALVDLKLQQEESNFLEKLLGILK